MTEIAIIGMAGRFPGAGDLGQYRANLAAGHDGVTRLTPAELHEQLGGPPASGFVAASGRIRGAYDFDAAHYGMAPREAIIVDPQQRLFLDHASHALDDAGVVPSDAVVTAVFGGVGRCGYEPFAQAAFPEHDVLVEVGNVKDHLCSRVAYRLGCTGPAVVVQSACSTGLLAVHQATLTLIAGEADVAVVGASAVRVPVALGYRYREGDIASPDGYCRPFSTLARGTVPGDGVGAVVLKRLDDAIADRDHVYAVIGGSAANNDGRKDGYAMVSAAAQERVLRAALDVAGVEPAEVGYIEAHGTGTPVGDATEWGALERVYGGETGDGAFVGAVKSMLGHLREASGMAGLLKAVVAVGDGTVAPTLHVEQPATFVTRSDGRLRLATASTSWSLERRPFAAVSSFGLGGTNVHLLLRAHDTPASAPAQEREHDTAGPVLLSAPSPPALRRTVEAWRTWLRDAPLVPAPADIAGCSQLRRRHHRHRAFVPGGARAALPAQLDELADRVAEIGGTDAHALAVGAAFAFPGAGHQYRGMAAGLGAAVPGFTATLDDALGRCEAVLGLDLREFLRSDERCGAGAPGTVDLRRMLAADDDAPSQGVVGQSAVFSVQMALTEALRRCGVGPQAVVGHSLGELAAATVAGVFTLEDACEVTARRAEIVAAQPRGAMLAVPMSPDEAAALGGESVTLAAINGRESCVLAGPVPDVERVEELLQERDRPGRRLPSRHAFHTPMLAAAAEELERLLEGVPMRAPQLPMVSSVTGTWATADVSTPAYWARQLVSPVRFEEALRTLAARWPVLVEVGPGQTRLAAAQARSALPDVVAVPTVRRSYDRRDDLVVLTTALAELWSHGLAVRWEALTTTPVRGVPLPPVARAPRRLDAQDVAPAAPGATPAVIADDVPEATGHDPGADGGHGPEGRAEHALTGIVARTWCEVLGVEEVRPHDDFFALGGDSLMGTVLIARLERALGTGVPPRVVFSDASARGMARQIGQFLDGLEQP